MLKRMMKTRSNFLYIRLSYVLTLSWMVKHYSRSCLCRFNKQQSVLLSVLLIENLIINASWRAKLTCTTFHFCILLLQDVPSLFFFFPVFSFLFCVCGHSWQQFQLSEWVCSCAVCVPGTDCGSWKREDSHILGMACHCRSFVRSCQSCFTERKFILTVNLKLCKNRLYSSALLMLCSDPLLFVPQ